MGPLAAVERFLERLFERQSARLFRTSIRPVQVQRRLERTMEEGRVRDGVRTVVPHQFDIHLNPDDLDALRAAAPELAATIADAALAFARSHGYTLLDRPVVAIRADRTVATGDVVVDSIERHPGSVDGPAVDAHGSMAGDGERQPDRIHGATRSSAASGDLDRPPSNETAVFVVPGIDGPRATIREIRPDHSSRTISFDGRPLTIGRANDNAVVLRDGRASRHHARIDARRGSLVLSDLGSTNGSFVNDRRVESIALGEGDRIRVGTTTLLVEAIAVSDSTDPTAGSTGDDPAAATSTEGRSRRAIDDVADGSIAG
jgi:hypothetical protein